MTVLPDGFNEILQLQSHGNDFKNLEYRRAIGIVTLQPFDGFGQVIVMPIDVKIFLRDPRPSQQCPSRSRRIFGSFLFSCFSFNQKLVQRSMYAFLCIFIVIC